MRFENLGIDKRVVEILNINRLFMATEIQSQTYKMAISGVDVVGVSKTGSGKTLAFLLPIINQILTSDKPYHTLIIAPTRELALQISDCISLFESLGIRHATLVGGGLFSSQVPALNNHPHIVVGTPGRIAKHILKTKNFKIGSIRKLILDEADRFFDQDFSEDLGVIASRLVKKNQALMFTATLTEKTKNLSKIFMRDPKIIGSFTKYECVETLKDSLVIIPEKYKLTVLCNYLKKCSESLSSVIVFSAMCRDSQRISELLKRMGLSSECLHG
ncbi:ATP-dependent RNA helicase DDX47/RRP3, partial [Pancytospora epiphaga]